MFSFLVFIVMLLYFFFFFNDTATTEIYTLSLHDALPIWPLTMIKRPRKPLRLSTDMTLTPSSSGMQRSSVRTSGFQLRSEEHTSELQSRQYLVCRLLLEKKKK